MKLFEIKDPSDYRPGDERLPGSPYYEDPFADGIPDLFYPDLPTFHVQTGDGELPNGERYNFVLTSSYTEGDRDQYILWEHALNELAGAKGFEQAELVDQATERNGKTVMWRDYYMTGRGFPADQVLKFLNDAMEPVAAEMAERRAYDTAADDPNWDYDPDQDRY